MTYRVLCLEATATLNTPPGKGKAKAKLKAGKAAVGERTYFEGLRIDTVFSEFVEGMDPRSQAEMAARVWVGEKSGRRAIVVADIVQFTSGVLVESNHSEASVRREM